MLLDRCPICGTELRLFQTTLEISLVSVVVDEEIELLEPQRGTLISSEIQESYVQCINGHSEPEMMEDL